MQCRLDVRGLNHCQGPQKPDTGSRPLPAHVSVVQAALRQSRLPAQPGDASVGRSGSSRVARPAGSGRQQRAGQSVSIAEAPVQPTVEHLHHVPASGPTENGMLSNDRLQQHLQQHQRTTGPVLLTFPFTMHQLLALKATTWAGSMDKAAGLLGVTKVWPFVACQASPARSVLTVLPARMLHQKLVACALCHASDKCGCFSQAPPFSLLSWTSPEPLCVSIQTDMDISMSLCLAFILISPCLICCPLTPSCA